MVIIDIAFLFFAYAPFDVKTEEQVFEHCLLFI